MSVRSGMVVALLLGVGATFSSGADPSREGGGDILPTWLGVDAKSEAETLWSRRIEVEGEVRSARLRLTADFAFAWVNVNDAERVVVVGPYAPPAEIELRDWLTAGTNELVVGGSAVAGPSAVAMRLSVTFEDGRTASWVTDDSWSTVDGAAVDLRGTVDPRRWALNHLEDVAPTAEYNQWKEALAGTGGVAALDESLSPLPEGFSIQRLHRALPGEGSWVSLAIDPKGRMIIGRESQGLLRLSMPEAGDGELGVEVINDSLKECRGLAFRGDVLYANANTSKGLYRLRDTTGDDQFDEVTLVQATEGSVGHGRNDIVLGPDERVHAIHGDVVLVPEGATRRTVPEPEGEAPKELGHWVSSSGDTEGVADWRILSRGLRNPYGIDFNADGEAFSYDADNEGDVGLPFYRPTRINHLVSGANYGWHQRRGNTRSLPVDAPDGVPTTFDVGRGSPTAVKFGDGSDFPAPWKEALFALDWAYGRIVAVHLTPRGASYHGSGETFLEGRPLNVTDLDFLPNGRMVFITGGRKTQSALFEVGYFGDHPTRPEATRQAVGRAAFSKQRRALRRELEACHGREVDGAVELARNHLADHDPWIRNAARVALESQPLDRWRERTLGGELDRGGILALMSLARQGGDQDRRRIADRLAPAIGGQEVINGGVLDLELLRLFELVSEPLAQRLDGDDLAGLATWPLDDTQPRLAVGREQARVLALLDSPAAIELCLGRMAAATSQGEQLHYLECLSHVRSNWTGESRQRFFQALAHAESTARGDRFMPDFFSAVRGRALAAISDDDEREAFGRLLEAGVASEPVPPAEPRPIVRHWTLADFPEALLIDPATWADRDQDAGRRAYDAALCSACHMAGEVGRPVGPDLTTVGRRFSVAELLESIIEPSRVVAEVHRNVVLTLEEGSTVVGRIVSDDFRKSELTLATNAFDPSERVTVAKDGVRTFEESPVSPMPPGLLDTLSREEVLDLLAWLTSGG